MGVTFLRCRRTCVSYHVQYCLRDNILLLMNTTIMKYRRRLNTCWHPFFFIYKKHFCQTFSVCFLYIVKSLGFLIKISYFSSTHHIAFSLFVLLMAILPLTLDGMLVDESYFTQSHFTMVIGISTIFDPVELSPFLD